MNWSTEQQRIFDWFGTGSGALLVRARAGTGKTTTIVEGIRHASDDESVLLCAFNKRIATELAERLDHPNAEALTLHSVGFQAVRMFWNSVRLEQRRGERKYDLATRAAGTQAPDAIVTLVANLHTHAREMAPLATSADELRSIAWAHDCVPDAEWEDFGWDLDGVCRAALKAMTLAKKKPTTGIDFSDMLYLPVANNWLRPKYTLVCVDEAQDMNACQLIIAQRVAKDRVCVIGDDRQAIYAFRGADAGALDRLKLELSAEEMGLTTTYRCGQSIVAEAQRIVPDYRAAANNPQGTVTSISEDDLLDRAQPRDVVLSRVNAPLIDFCLKALRRGIPARVEGRDVAAGLRKMVKDLAKGPARNSIPAFLRRLESWEAKEVTRARASANGDADTKVDQIRDRAEALRSLAEGASGIPELQARIEEVFTQIKKGAALTFSSVHKAKGLEWRRVFVLADTLKDTSEEELNIQYVAITRAIADLIWVGARAADADEGGE